MTTAGMFVRLRLRLCVRPFVRPCVQPCVRVHVRMRVLMYIHARARAHTHTHPGTRVFVTFIKIYAAVSSCSVCFGSFLSCGESAL